MFPGMGEAQNITSQQIGITVKQFTEGIFVATSDLLQ
jgi:hypothetical protein